jgi:hypothetical protein
VKKLNVNNLKYGIPECHPDARYPTSNDGTLRLFGREREKKKRKRKGKNSKCCCY